MKLRKIAAVFMTTILAVTSLAACGSKDTEESGDKSESPKASIDSFESVIENGVSIENCSFEGKFSISASGKDIVSDDASEEMAIFNVKDNKLTASVTVNGKADTKNGNSEVKLGLNINNAIKSDLFEILSVDGNYYLGMDTLKSGFAEIAATVTEADSADVQDQISAYLPEGAYLKITQDMLKELMSDTSSAIGDTDVSGLVSSVDTAKATELAKYFIELINKGIKKGSGDAYSNDGDTYKLVINKDNINDIISGLADVISDESETIAKKLSDISGETLDADTLKSNIALLKSYDVASLMGDKDFEVSISTSYVDDAWSMDISAKVSDSDNELVAGVSYKAEKTDDIEIKAPTDLVSDEDTDAIMKQLTDSMDSISDNASNKILPIDGDDASNDDYSDLWDDDSDLWDDDSDLGDDEEATTKAADNKKKDTKTDSSYTYSSVKEFAESEEFQSQIENLKDSLGKNGLNLDVTGEGNKLVYTYQYKEITVDEDMASQMADSLKSTLASSESQFTSLASSLAQEIDVENPVVVIKYIDAEGTVIYEAEYEAE